MPSRQALLAIPIVFVTLLADHRVHAAAFICGEDQTLEFTGVPILPFGGEYLGASTVEGEIIGATLDITFETAGNFDAANLGFSLNLPVVTEQGVGAAFSFSGAAMGWSGQGTFNASIQSNSLNGVIDSGGQSFYTWFLTLVNGNPGGGPISGTFVDFRYTLTYASCSPGDVDGDGDLDIDDAHALTAVLVESPLDPADVNRADVNQDGETDGRDCQRFVDLLLATP